MGKSHAAELARSGAKVAVLEIEGEAGATAAKEINTSGGAAVAHTVDVADRTAVERTVTAIADQWGRIDIVVSNAGTIHSAKGLLETDDDDWHRAFAVHVDGCLHITRAAMPWLVKSPAGRVIIVGSMWGQRGDGHSYAYAAAKGALMAFGRNLAAEFGPQGVCINTISPGVCRRAWPPTTRTKTSSRTVRRSPSVVGRTPRRSQISLPSWPRISPPTSPDRRSPSTAAK